MTTEQKQAKRRLRREIYQRALRDATRRMGLFARDAQLKAAAKALTDRFFAYSRHAPAEVKQIAPNG